MITPLDVQEELYGRFSMVIKALSLNDFLLTSLLYIFNKYFYLPLFNHTFRQYIYSM